MLISEGLSALVALLKVEETRAPIAKFKDLTPVLLSLVQPNMSLVQQNQVSSIIKYYVDLSLFGFRTTSATQPWHCTC